MTGRKLILHAVYAQLLICCWILLKVILLPYVIWKFLGTSPAAARTGDLLALLIGTCAALSMGMVGYWHAARYPAGHSRWQIAVGAMGFIHLPLYLFVLYKWWFGSAWDTYWTAYLSGWLSIVTHPMILVGFYGKWVDLIGAFVLCGCYLAGVWMYFDEQKDLEIRRMRRG